MSPTSYQTALPRDHVLLNAKSRVGGCQEIIPQCHTKIGMSGLNQIEMSAFQAEPFAMCASSGHLGRWRGGSLEGLGRLDGSGAVGCGVHPAQTVRMGLPGRMASRLAGPVGVPLGCQLVGQALEGVLTTGVQLEDADAGGSRRLAAAPPATGSTTAAGTRSAGWSARSGTAAL